MFSTESLHHRPERYAPEVRDILRTAAHAADAENRRVTPVDIRRAMAAPLSGLEVVQLKKTAATEEVLQRASRLAQDRAAAHVELADLIEALAEQDAASEGLDLARLRFARFAVQRARHQSIADLRTRVYSGRLDLAAPSS